jgi:hypothetical protein
MPEAELRFCQSAKRYGLVTGLSIYASIAALRIPEYDPHYDANTDNTKYNSYDSSRRIEFTYYDFLDVGVMNHPFECPSSMSLFEEVTSHSIPTVNSRMGI